MMIMLLCCSLTIPLIMIVAGWLLRKRPPAHISSFVGYRTARSMASPESWRFAQEDCGRRWQRAGWAMLLPSAAVQLLLGSRNDDAASMVSLILMTAQTLIMILVTLRTERALRCIFTPDGKRL
ncbi:MAG: SdpI family protein [Aristaeellaceae bacterium]